MARVPTQSRSKLVTLIANLLLMVMQKGLKTPVELLRVGDNGKNYPHVLCRFLVCSTTPKKNGKSSCPRLPELLRNHLCLTEGLVTLKEDSNTVKSAFEPCFIALSEFYRTAIKVFPHEIRQHVVRLVVVVGITPSHYTEDVDVAGLVDGGLAEMATFDAGALNSCSTSLR